MIGLTATARSPWSIQLSWTNPPDPDLEWVEVRSDGDSWGTDVEETTYTDRYLQPGTTHTYTLRTYDTAENAGPPVSVSATTWAQAPVVGPATSVVRISTDSAATQANEGSYGAVWSPDSTMVAFESWASNLVPGDTNECSDVFVKNLSSGVLLRISTSASGGQSNGCAYRPSWAPDGSRIAFESWASNLVADDTNRSNDVFIKTLQSGAVQRVSTTGIGGQTNNDSYGPAWSADGTQIAFQSYADNLVAEDTNDDSDIFVKTLQGGAIQRISTTATGGQSNGGASAPAWSPDGMQIAFESWASNLLPGDTNEVGDIFVKTLTSGAVQRISTAAGGGQGNDGAYRPVWSPTGTRIAFESWSTNLVPDDTNDSTDVFVTTLASGAVERVSTTAGGGQGDNGAGSPVWSHDGTRIAFESWSTNLVPDDINDSTDVFVKTLATGAIQLVSTDSAGRLVDSGAGGPGFSPDGAKIAFGSWSSGLVLGDTNGVDDLFVKTLP